MTILVDLDPSELISLWILKYVDSLTQLGYVYLKDWGRAEDVAQETFIKAYKSIHQLKDMDKAHAWLARILINECKMVRRRRWREMVTDFFPEKPVISSEDQYIRKADFKEIHDAIMALPEVYRTPIFLFYIQDMPTEKIANIMGVQPTTIRTRLSRARAMLQKQLERGE